MTVVLTEYNEKIKIWLKEHEAALEKIRTSSEKSLQDLEENLSTLESIKSGFRSFKGMISHLTETFSQEVKKVANA